jgi:hypothetical protein
MMRPVRWMAAIALLAAVVPPAWASQAPQPCPPAGWTAASLATLKANKFAVEDPTARRSLALAITACLADPNPALRDGIAFEGLTTWLRAGALDRSTLIELRDRLLPMLASRDSQGFRAPFAAIVMAEVARTDRIAAWMSAEERDALVQAAAAYLTGIDDYRAFSDKEGFRHGVAHGADFALQLVLNPAITKAQLDRLLAAIATQAAPQKAAFTAGEPDRLARPILFIAQRALHTDEEWKAWFATMLSPKPMAAWGEAFSSEAGLAKRHNARALLLSLYASASATENAGVRQLLAPIREGLKLLP